MRSVTLGPVAEVLRSADPVALSFAGALLAESGIEHHVAGRHDSESALIGLQPRLVVPDDSAGAARRLLVDAGLLD